MNTKRINNTNLIKFLLYSERNQFGIKHEFGEHILRIIGIRVIFSYYVVISQTLSNIMIKLSKTGWNNVIIFSVMGFILLINVTSKNVYGPDDSESLSTNSAQELALIGQHQTILTLSVDNVVVIERIGRTWRAMPANISGQALEQMMMSWQQSQGVLMSSAPEIDRQFSLDVQLDIAGQSDALKFNFYATEQQLMVFNEASQQWLSMPIAIYGQLFPQEIFAN
jgi:hypothetical protein